MRRQRDVHTRVWFATFGDSTIKGRDLGISAE